MMPNRRTGSEPVFESHRIWSWIDGRHARAPEFRRHAAAWPRPAGRPSPHV